MLFSNISKEYPVIALWSGGITSAVTCKLCSDWFGNQNVRFLFSDTHNEDADTYRFKNECENWYGKEIESICSDRFYNPKEVWYWSKSFHAGTGANCSSYLKRIVREKFQKENKYSYHAFGFDINETNRAIAMQLNHPDARPIFPLIIK